MPSSDTKDRILDAAERLFGERGIAGTSLRTVTKEAGVNLAAVHYHFGSKEALCKAVLTRRIGPVNAERLALLDRLEARSEPPPVEAVLEAFVDPVMSLKRDLGELGAVWSRLIGRFYCEPAELIEELARDQFEDVGRRFLSALVRALPELPPAEIYERFQFVVAVLTHVLSDSRRIDVLPEYGHRDADDGHMVGRMCAFLAAGLRAPIDARPPAPGAGGRA